MQLYTRYKHTGHRLSSFVLLQHDRPNCYYSGRGLPWATVYKLILHGCEVVKGNCLFLPDYGPFGRRGVRRDAV